MGGKIIFPTTAQSAIISRSLHKSEEKEKLLQIIMEKHFQKVAEMQQKASLQNSWTKPEVAQSMFFLPLIKHDQEEESPSVCPEDKTQTVAAAWIQGTKGNGTTNSSCCWNLGYSQSCFKNMANLRSLHCKLLMLSERLQETFEICRSPVNIALSPMDVSELSAERKGRNIGTRCRGYISELRGLASHPKAMRSLLFGKHLENPKKGQWPYFEIIEDRTIF